MELKDTYYTLKDKSEGFYKEKGSKFLAFAFPVQNENETKVYIHKLKKKYYDARHHCYAYILGFDGENFRANDDGEPGHSAGDPILGQIRSNNLTNTLIVVVRYFGGTKLGVSGLINAYRTAAGNAIENNIILEKYIISEISIQFEYPELNQVMKLIKDHDLDIISQKMEASCEMKLGVRLSRKEMVISKIQELHKISLS